jgi:hypothetical protein
MLSCVLDVFSKRKCAVRRVVGGEADENLEKEKKMLSCLLDMFSKRKCADLRFVGGDQADENLERRRGGRSRKL